MEKAIAEYNVEAVKKLVNEATSNDDNDSKEVIAALFEKISRSRAMNMIKMKASIEEIERFFLFVVEVAKSDLCSKILSVSIIQDLLECSKKSKCADIFTIVENHIGVWKAPEFFEQCKNSVLRMCNDLLKRLSRTIDTQFCGRINILLARSLPLNEKSGLNPTGQFNSTNETEYDLELDESELKTNQKEEDNNVDIDSVPEIPVDFKLYQQFWQLQKYFCDPNKIYQKNEFDIFQKNLNEVLIVFTTYRLDKRRSNHNHHDTTMEGIEEAIKRPDVFFAKYQTSQKLLHLQFADPQFRRYFLVQCLILVNYLQSDVRFRDETCFLTEEQTKFVTEISEKCCKLLRDTYPRGHHFAEFVKKLLSREKIWSTWKNEGCPDWLSNRPERIVKSFRRHPLPTYDPKKIDLGNEVLNRLWSLSSDNLSACKDRKRNFVPKLDDIIADALDHADPEQGVEEKESCFNNEVWQWKQSRLFLTEGDNFLTVQSTPAARKPCPEYSEVLRRGVYSIAMHSQSESMRARGKEVSQRAEEYRIKKEEDAKKAEEEERQKAEEDAKRKAMEAAAERKKKEEELAAKRAQEMATIAARKPRKEPESKEAEKEEETKSIKLEPKEREKEKENGSETSPSRKERRKTVDSRTSSPSEPRKDRRIKVENGNSSPQEPRKQRKKSVENGNSTPPKSRKRATPVDSDSRKHAAPADSEESNPKRSRRNGNDTKRTTSPAPSSRRASSRTKKEHERERSSRRRTPDRY